jgi:hypothetical protein
MYDVGMERDDVPLDVAVALCDGFCSTANPQPLWCPEGLGDSQEDGSNAVAGLSAGAAAGVGIGAFVLGAIIVGFLVFFLVKKEDGGGGATA